MGACYHGPGVVCDNCRGSWTAPPVTAAPMPVWPNPSYPPAVNPIYPPSPRPWQLCPVCEGKGAVPEDFYPHEPAWLPGEEHEVDDEYRTCLTCCGKGVLSHA